jgi:hypothetical protein
MLFLFWPGCFYCEDVLYLLFGFWETSWLSHGHLFKQMYADEVAFEVLSETDLIDLVFTELLSREIELLKIFYKCTCEEESEPTCLEEMSKDDRWVTFTEQVINSLDHRYVWQAILEAFKVLKYPNPTSEHKTYFEQLYGVSCSGQCEIHSKLNITPSVSYLMDYITCVCKLKYES